MPHNNQGNVANRAAAARYSRLRAAGVQGILTSHLAWYLSGGVAGEQHNHDTLVPLAAVAKKVPDCEHFIADYREAREAITV